ncbi:MAG TPA: hypothetical protein P5268_09080 [Candidatus Marinimicrobia bacterium]|nr:hypothetical protein [Candidatus Neomarinimicrobiota bacterium]HRS52574.1 hypothetical protein [Candidatus Neomarinimicrobiota bacterium]HRU93168.1 hypothetical protein [Candidatus Neomarinimicrobiota bacterium]
MLRNKSVRRIITNSSLVLTLFCGLAYSQTKILHSPPREVYVGSPVLIEAIVDQLVAEIRNVKIYYRESGQESFLEDDMNEIMGVFKYYIPAKFVTDNGIEYLIMAEFVNGSMAAFPEVDPFNVPMFISARRKAGEAEITPDVIQANLLGGTPSNVIILSPEESQVVASSEVLIAVSLFNAENIALHTIKVEIDGNNITPISQIEEDLIIARPQNLRPGIHTIRITFADVNGAFGNPLQWNFRVVGSVGEAERVFKYNGRVLAEVNSEQVRGISQNIQQVTSGFNGSYDWIKFQANVFVTSEESPFKQPRNRYTAGFSSNYFEMNFGDINPQFSEFGLSGKRVRGVEAHLKLNFFNLRVIDGETERSIEGTISDVPKIVVSSGDTLFEYSRTGYTYGQRLLAVRPYFGSGKHFQLGFNFIKAIDDTLSVHKEMNDIFASGNQIIRMDGATPQDNIVVGSDLKLAFDNQRFVWKNAVALSMLNRNISGGALSKDDTLALGDFNIPISTFGFDPSSIEKIFIINKYQFPISPIALDSVENVKDPILKIQVDDSTQLAFGIKEILNMPSAAFRSTLNLNYFHNYITIKYQHIGGSFYSLGNPYMRKDIQGYIISDRIRLFQNKIFLNLNYEQNRDNLNNDKNATTTTSSFMAGLSLFLGENLPRIDLNTVQYGRKNDATTVDTTWYGTAYVDSFSVKDNRESNITTRQDIRISHSVNFLNVKNTLNFSWSSSDRSDRLADSRPEGYLFSSMKTSMISFGINSTFPFPLQTNLSLSNNHSESGLNPEPYDFVSLGAQGQYDFFNKTLGVYAGYGLMNGKGLADYTQNNIFGGFIFNFKKIHQLRTNVRYVYLDDRSSGEQFHDLSYFVTYSLNF